MTEQNHSHRALAVVIDPQPSHLHTYESVLEQMGVECVCVPEQDVRDFGEQQRCIGVLWDLSARASGETDAIRRLRQIPGFERTPLVLITDAPVGEFNEPGVVGCLRLPPAPGVLRNQIALLLELRASEQRYRALLEHPAEVIVVFEAARTAAGVIEDWVYLDANMNALKVLRATREALVGKRLSEVVPDRAPRLIPVFAQVLQTGVPYRYESVFDSAEFLNCVFPMGDNCVVGSGTDVTARNRAEREVQRLVQALNAEKEWLFAALNSIHDEVYFTDPKGRYTYANPSALREFGYASVEGTAVEEILSDLVVLRADGTPRPIEEAPPLRALKGEAVNDEGQIVQLPRTGEFRHRQVSSAPVRSTEGNVIGSVSVVRDVTESKNAEARLREAVKQAQAAEAESRTALAAELTAMKRLHDLSTIAIRTDDLQALLEEILDATIALHSADYGSVRLFDAQAGTLRIAAQRGLDQRYLDRFAVIDCREAPVWTKALTQRERFIMEDIDLPGQPTFLRHLAQQAGSRAMQSTPLFTAGGAPLGMLTTHFASPRNFSANELRLTDLYARQAGIAIERKQAEAALITARESADRANKGKSHFLRAASHDLRQPVQTLAMLNGILRSSEIDGSILAIVQQQGEAIDTMAHLLDVLLNISKLESGVVKPEISDFPVEPLLSRLRQEFSSLVDSKGLELNIDCYGSPLMRSDPRLVGEILRNLLANAIKFTPRGSIILRCTRDQETVRLEVIDTGVGIPRDELPLIFGEFYQVGVSATVSRQGYGLGLAIVQRMASILEVRIDVESEVGRGSRFSLAVPAGDLQAADLGASAKTPRNPASITSSTILLVEDHAAVRNAMELFFTMQGYRVISTASVEQTLAAIGSPPRPDLLITDFHLPGGKTGSDVIRSVRKVLGENFPAILISGDTSAEVSDLATDSLVRFTTKPINPDDLVGLVQELLDEAGRVEKAYTK